MEKVKMNNGILKIDGHKYRTEKNESNKRILLF